MPHRGIGYSARQIPIGHHPQDVEVFDADRSVGPCQFGGELVVDIPTNVGDLLMLPRDLQPLLLIVVAKHRSFGFWVFGFLFLAELALQLAEFFEMEC